VKEIPWLFKKRNDRAGYRKRRPDEVRHRPAVMDNADRIMARPILSGQEREPAAD
jgi:hypothetical protein